MQAVRGSVLIVSSRSQCDSPHQQPTFLDTDDYVPRRGTENRTARKYVVPIHFIKNMYRQNLWDRVGVSSDTTTLSIKKTIGIEYVTPDTEAVSVNIPRNILPRTTL